MLDLDFQFQEEPFLYAIKDNFLSKELIADLNEEFPHTLIQSSEIGDRMKLTKSRKRSENIILPHCWEHFLSEIDNKQFILNLIDKARSILEKETKIDFFKNIKIVDRRQKSDCSNSFFLDYDISEARLGYEREIHHDTDSRLISFLFHINDADIEGGDLELYSSSEKTIHSRQNPKNVSYHSSIEHKKNRIIFFVSNKKSYHSVQKITKCKIPRRFLYGSITHCGTGVWK